MRLFPGHGIAWEKLETDVDGEAVSVFPANRVFIADMSATPSGGSHGPRPAETGRDGLQDEGNARSTDPALEVQRQAHLEACNWVMSMSAVLEMIELHTCKILEDPAACQVQFGQENFETHSDQADVPGEELICPLLTRRLL